MTYSILPSFPTDTARRLHNVSDTGLATVTHPRPTTGVDSQRTYDSPNVESQRGRRLYDIDRAKGLAIFLVVLGHVVARQPPQDNTWFVSLKAILYTFHLPFFFFLAGITFSYTYTAPTTVREYCLFVAKKARRLLPGFLLFGLIILAGKQLAGHFLHVDNSDTDVWRGVAHLLIHPLQSPAGSLWFIYVLLEFYILLPPLLWISRYNPIVYCALALAIHFCSATRYFMLDAIAEYAVFVVLGVAAGTRYILYVKAISKYWVVAGVLFTISLISMYFIGPTFSSLIVPLFAIPALHGLVISGPWKQSSLLALFGHYVFAIYLMNTIAIGLTKGIMLKFVSWDGIMFFAFLPTLLVAGLCIPIVVKKYLLSQSAFLNRITS